MTSPRHARQAQTQNGRNDGHLQYHYTHDDLFQQQQQQQQQDDGNLPPPRKDRHKQEKQKKKKKRAHNDYLETSLNRSASTPTAKAADRSTPAEADVTAEDEDEEADDEESAMRHPKKKVKRHAANAVTVAAAGPSRLILRLPNNTHNKRSTTKRKSPRSAYHLGVAHTSTSPSTLASSLASPAGTHLQSQQEADDEDVIPDFALAPTGFQLTYASDSSEDFSDLAEEDDEDVTGAEEAYLIADKLKKMDRKFRKGSHSPNLTQSQGSDREAGDTTQKPSTDANPDSSSILFEIAQIRRNSDPGTAPGVQAQQDTPVTWSGAEDSDLDNLDELLGLTTNESAALVGELGRREAKTMRFEDFMAADDGDGSDSSDEESDTSVDSLTMQGYSTENLDLDVDNEHIATTREVVQNGGFVFYKAGPGDSTEDELTADDVSDVDADDGGDTTDTLDDTDHLGLVRFGIEAVDEDDEDAEEALQHAMMDRHMSDARNMGLSISFEALAQQPELVVTKTAKSLGVSTETAAKILTSVGMSILLNANNTPEPTSFKQPHRKNKPALGNGQAKLTDKIGQSNIPDSGKSSLPIPAAPLAGDILQNGVPVLGNFEPAGETELCVVVAQSSMPAPSPFSARKRRRPRGLTAGSPSGASQLRGQSVVSSISSQSFTSIHPYHSNSSEEPHYNIVLDLDDLVDASMLPQGMSSVSEDDEDIDETASVSTGMGVAPVGDTSRWNRIPIGAFRSAHPSGSQYSPLAAAIFSGVRDPALAQNLSFHGGITSSVRALRNRHIPVSPVLFPVGQSLKSISQAKSRKERRADKKQRKSSRTSTRSHLGTSKNPSTTVSNALGHSAPSAGLSHHISPLFSGIASAVHIPPLSLGDPNI